MKLYGFKGDSELFSQEKLNYSIDFGSKYSQKDLEDVVLEDFDWFLWNLEKGSLYKGYLQMPSFFTLKLNLMAYILKRHLTEKQIAVLAATFDENAFSSYLEKLNEQYFPKDINPFWKRLFVDKYSEILLNLTKINSISERKSNLYTSYKLFGSISFYSPYYFAVSQKLYSIGYKSTLIDVSPKVISNDYAFDKYNLVISDVIPNNDKLTISEILTIIELLENEIAYITINHLPKQHALVFKLRYTSNMLRKEKDVSSPLLAKDFLKICKLKNVSNFKDLLINFPNANPRSIEEIEEEREEKNRQFEEERERQERNEWDREYIKYIRQAEIDFYAEFDGYFHEDML